MTNASDIRVLSMWEPWASLTVTRMRTDHLGGEHFWKEWETRSWTPRQKKIELPFTVAIHATKKVVRSVLDKWPFYLPFPKMQLRPGHIIGLATVMEVIPVEEWLLRYASGGHDIERAVGDYSANRFAWRLTYPQPLREPIPWTGRQEPLYFLPRDVAQRVIAQTEWVAQ